MNDIVERRAALSAYCKRARVGAYNRAKATGIPFAIGKYTLHDMMVDQEWRCAVTALPFEMRATSNDPLLPFGPSLDRIVPSLGYVPGNVRLVCNIVNFAMNQWGLETLQRLATALQVAPQRLEEIAGRRKLLERRRNRKRRSSNNTSVSKKSQLQGID